MKNKDSQKNRKLRNDIILAVVIVLIAAAGLLIFTLTKEEGSSVVVKINDVQTASYPLSENIEVTISTNENTNENVLVIEDGKAYMKKADCPDKICVESRAISYVGETIICLPHRVAIEVVGEADDGIDVAV